jgi:PPOX class probable F420-dependent enzyme
MSDNASRAEALTRFAAAPVASLATTRPSGRPHVVPVTFIVADDTVYSLIDAKPKTTTALQRLANIAANPAVSLLAHHYEDEWANLWWVRVDGNAAVTEDADVLASLREPFVAKYPQYRDQPTAQSAIVIEVTGVVAWEW